MEISDHGIFASPHGIPRRKVTQLYLLGKTKINS